MRVITGTARGRKLRTLEGMDVRPTTDQVKEAMFSIIQFDVPGAQVLDLFSGSGQLGIEALSRGAAFCVFVDSSRAAQEVIRENLQHVGLFKQSRVAAMDYLAFLSSTKEVFDIALLDPPYHKQMIPQAMELLAEKMNDNGIVLCETAKEEELPEQTGTFEISRTYRYGKIKLTVYRKKEKTA